VVIGGWNLVNNAYEITQFAGVAVIDGTA